MIDSAHALRSELRRGVSSKKVLVAVFAAAFVIGAVLGALRKGS